MAQVGTAEDVSSSEADAGASAVAGQGTLAGYGRNALWTYGSMTIWTIGGLVVTGYAVRRLGAGRYSYYGMASAITAILIVFDVGLSMGVVRAMATQATTTDEVLRTAKRREIAAAHATYILIGVAGGVLAVAVAAALPWLTPVANQDLWSARGTAFFVVLAAAIQLGTSTLTGIPMGARNYRLTGLAIVAGTVLNFVIVVLGVGRLGVAALGLGSIGSVLASRLIQLAWVRRNARWFRLRPAIPRKQEMRAVATFALPLLLLAAGGQIINATDLYVVGLVSTASAVGFYRVGMMLPSRSSSLLFRGYDVAYPSLAAAGPAQADQALRTLTRLASFAGGLGFGVLLWRAPDFVRLLLGSRNTLTTEVFRLFAVTWMLNVTIHGIGLTLISRGRHRAYAQLGMAEIVANIGLTFAIAHWKGPVGAAIATLLITGVFDTVVLPLWVRKEFSLPIMRVVLLDGISVTLFGLAIASAASLLASRTTGAVAHVAVATASAGAFGAGVLAIVFKFRGSQLFRPAGKHRLMERPLNEVGS